MGRTKADRMRISMKQVHEVRYWCKHFGIQKWLLQEAVDSVGHDKDKVRHWLHRYFAS